MKLPRRMTAAVLTGHGGLEKLLVRDDVPVPTPQPMEVLIEVGACGINNTDINTRIGWYSKTVGTGTTARDGAGGIRQVASEDATWGGRAVVFPRIQGADVVGRIVAVGAGVAPERMGERVLVDPWLREPSDPDNRNLAGYLGSERDGGFAQYTTVPAPNAFAISSGLSDAQLATFPCSYSTAEHMLDRVRLAKGEQVLIPGASGGVGSALVQLARRRGARVAAITSGSKLDAVKALGADVVLDRDHGASEHRLRELLHEGAADVIADVVGGAFFALALNLLRRGGRYVTAGAIAGPMVELDLRTLYLKDLEMHGATVMPVGTFAKLVRYIEKELVRPLVAQEFALGHIHKAQEVFLAKKHFGNLVILPGR